MTNITETNAWRALQEHYKAMNKLHMRDLFQQDPQRFERFSLSTADIFLDYSKNRITPETMDLLLALPDSIQLKEKIEAFFTGSPLDKTSFPPPLHTALRSTQIDPIKVNGEDILPAIKLAITQMQSFAQAILLHEWRGYSGEPITDIVNIGIGGSDLGPAMVYEALKPYSNNKLQCHFISTIDGNHINNVLKKLQPKNTLFIISSKSFSTAETLVNGKLAMQWLQNATDSKTVLKQHFVAVTANREKAIAYGISPDNIFPIWDWVTGRYSVWSAIGLPILLGIGSDQFQAFLAGAHAMDKHFHTAPFQANMPVIMALLGIWYINFFNAQSLAILPYDYSLRRLVAYLQQADMESNGKNICHEGNPIHYATAPIIWGEPGTNGQHAFHQLFYQGAPLVPADFIVPCQSHHEYHYHHELLFANCLSQTQALMCGKTFDEALEECLQEGMHEDAARKLAAHKIVPGNKPSNTIIFPKLTANTLGALIALYEHKIFVQGVVWGINSFDQWGVELGKQLSTKLMPLLNKSQTRVTIDCSTQGLIRYFQNQRQGTT